MKGCAHITGGSGSGKAQTIGRVTAVAVALGSLTAATKDVAPAIGGEAVRTRETAIFKWLHVQPEQPQEIQWIRREDVIQYSIECNTKWKIQ